jgi:hypothetical protein
MHGIVLVLGAGVRGGVCGGWFGRGFPGFWGGGGGVWGWVCGGGVVGVLFSKSPRGRPARSWEPEAANPLNFKTGSGRRFVRSGFWWGRVGWFVGRGNADLQSVPDSGKFEKLLRSDPRP